MTELQLSAVEARVIASLAEKAVTTPQYYPMTVNQIMLAANQKNSRDPVMKLTEGDVGAALNRLQELDLVRRDDSIGRTSRWRHQFQTYLLLQPSPFALLIALMLRGPQTVAELRANAAALGGPADMEGAQNGLKELADRAQPLVVLLPRGHGQKEARYAHALSGDPVEVPEIAEIGDRPQIPDLRSVPNLPANLEERVRQLEERVAALESLSKP